jgi:hypothetical protein
MSRGEMKRGIGRGRVEGVSEAEAGVRDDNDWIPGDGGHTEGRNQNDSEATAGEYCPQPPLWR